MQQYKIQNEQTKPLNWETFKEVISWLVIKCDFMINLYIGQVSSLVLYNQFITAPCFSAAIFLISTSLDDPYPVLVNVPGFFKFVVQLWTCWIAREVVFYYLHRLLHHGSFYQRYHKKHHGITLTLNNFLIQMWICKFLSGWTAPIAITAGKFHRIDLKLVHIKSTVNVFYTACTNYDVQRCKFKGNWVQS